MVSAGCNRDPASAGIDQPNTPTRRTVASQSVTPGFPEHSGIDRALAVEEPKTPKPRRTGDRPLTEYCRVLTKNTYPARSGIDPDSTLALPAECTCAPPRTRGSPLVIERDHETAKPRPHGEPAQKGARRTHRPNGYTVAQQSTPARLAADQHSPSGTAIVKHPPSTHFIRLESSGRRKCGGPERQRKAHQSRAGPRSRPRGERGDPSTPSSRTHADRDDRLQAGGDQVRGTSRRRCQKTHGHPRRKGRDRTRRRGEGRQREPADGADTPRRPEANPVLHPQSAEPWNGGHRAHHQRAHVDPNRHRRNTRNGHRPTGRRNAAKLARRREKRARAKAERGRRKARDSMPTTAASERRRNPLEVDRMREPHHTGTDLRNRRLHRDRRDCSQPGRAVHTTAEPGPTAIDRGLGHQTGRRGRRARRHHRHAGGTRSERRAAAPRRRARRSHREERPRATDPRCGHGSGGTASSR